MIIVTVIALVIGAVLDSADTNVRTTVALRNQAANNYGADGAVQAVLSALQASAAAGTAYCASTAGPTATPLGTTATPFYSPAGAPQGALNAYAQCTADPVNGLSPSTPPPSTTVSTVTPSPITTSVTSQPPATTTVTTVTPAPVTSTGPALGAGDPTLPSYGLLATGSASGDYGIDFSTSAGDKSVCIQNGSVASNKDIDILTAGTGKPTGQYLAVRLAPSVTGQGTDADCTTGTGVSPNGSRLLVTAAGSCYAVAPSYFNPTSCTPRAPKVATPAAPPLPGPITATNPAPVCANDANGKVTYLAYRPGLYTDVKVLNSPSSATCSNVLKSVVAWLTPGAYYFNFTSSAGTVWQWPTTLVTGTPTNGSGTPITGLDINTPSSLTNLANLGAAPSLCKEATRTNDVQGSELIFGGASIATANSGGSAEICASSSTTSPPVAIFGLTEDATVPLSTGGSVTIPAETVCSATGCGSTSLIDTNLNNSSGQAVIYFKGYVYAPNAQLDLTLKNSDGQVFNWGVVVRDFRFFVNGASAKPPFLELPSPNTAVGVAVTTSTPPPYPTSYVTTPPPTTIPSTTTPPPSPTTYTTSPPPTTTYTIRFINVWTCTVTSLQVSGRSTCPTSGSPNVQARVQISAGGTIKVLGWNHIR